MAYSFNKDDNNIINVVFTHEVDYQQRIDAVDQVSGLVTDGEPVKLLINLTNFINQMSFEEQESFGNYLANAKALENAKVASVTSHDGSSNVIVEAVAFTQGYQVVNFNNIQEAQAWLQGDLR